MDGKTWSSRGIDLYHMADLLVKLGAVNAVNLDGGGSSSMVINGTLVSLPSDTCPYSDMMRCEREVTTAICVVERVCEPGEYRPPLATACADCTPGRFSAVDGARECTSCAPGRFSASKRQRACSDCAAGRYQADTGGATCGDCPNGRFSPDAGARACETCPAGFTCAGPGAALPRPCGDPNEGPSAASGNAGARVDEGGMRSATLPAATAAATPAARRFFCPSGSGQAQHAPPGWYVYSRIASASRQGAPQQQNGSIVDDADAAGSGGGVESAAAGPDADATAAGVAAAEAASWLAKQRGGDATTAWSPPGAGSPIASQDKAAREEEVLVVCPVGMACLGGLAAPCAPGSFAAAEGSYVCTPCAPGFFASLAGMSHCEMCQADTVAPSTGAVRCDPCEPVNGQPRHAPGEGQTFCVRVDQGDPGALRTALWLTALCLVASIGSLMYSHRVTLDARLARYAARYPAVAAIQQCLEAARAQVAAWRQRICPPRGGGARRPWSSASTTCETIRFTKIGASEFDEDGTGSDGVADEDNKRRSDSHEKMKRQASGPRQPQLAALPVVPQGAQTQLVPRSCQKDRKE